MGFSAVVPAVGKFNGPVAVRQLSRWCFELEEDLVFNDPLHNVRVVPAGFRSDLASVRILRTICLLFAVFALVAYLFGWGWVSDLGVAVSFAALALYALVVGYGMRAAILHDWEYHMAELTRSEADGLFLRALHGGDGTAGWRSWLMFFGVRLGGFWRYGR